MSRTMTPEQGNARGLPGAYRRLRYRPAADRRQPRARAPAWPVRSAPTPIRDGLDAVLCGHASVMHARRALAGAEAHGTALMAALGLGTDGSAP